MFSGSYDPADVTFLLKPVRLEPTPVEEKEWLIQSGRRHYSEMISAEKLPSKDYLRVFHEGLESQKGRFGRDLLLLAHLIDRARQDAVTLVSLARAGTPVGVLLTRMLRWFGRVVTHYSVSIIRDRGIDEVALRYVLQRHPAESVVFVDGWTGKGVIARELAKAVEGFNRAHGTRLDPGLFAVADLCGMAAVAATAEDYLIPSCVLGATVSGLVSRSILNDSVIGPGDFHGCIYYEEFRAHDLSRWFVDRVADVGWHAFTAQTSEVLETSEVSKGPGVTDAEREKRRRENARFLREVQEQYKIRDVNHIKPGIGEATRVLLRRVPDCLLLREAELPEVAHLRVLAREKNVPEVLDPTLPYRAAALIQEVER